MLQNFSYNVYSRYRVAKPFPFVLVLGISAAIIHQVACFYTVKRSKICHSSTCKHDVQRIRKIVRAGLL